MKGHRHHPEIVESLASLEGAAGRQLGLTFVPHLVPMVRGILATVYARITKEADFQALFEKRYASEPFVDVLPPGSQPETRWVRGTNQCRIAVHRPFDGDTLVVLAVEDNLVKGAAGQAVQNMNLDVRLSRETRPRPGRACCRDARHRPAAAQQLRHRLVADDDPLAARVVLALAAEPAR